MFDPDSGGKKIPETVKRDIEKRIHAVANEQFSGRYTRLDIFFIKFYCNKLPFMVSYPHGIFGVSPYRQG